MHTAQAAYSNTTSSAPQPAREIPAQLQRLRDSIGELVRCSDLLMARTESVRRIPVPQAVGSSNDARSAEAAYAVPQTPLGTVLDEMARVIDAQIRSVNFAIDNVELA